MAFWEIFRRRKHSAQLQQTVSTAARAAIRGLSGGKETTDRWQEQFLWYDGVIGRNQYRSKDVMENLKIIRDLNPDASMAIWNFLRLGNNGHELECLATSGKPDNQGLDLLNALALRVGKLYGGGLDQLINVLLLAGYTQGAVALEVELNDAVNDVVDFHAVDPGTLQFRRNKETNEIELVQRQRDGTYKVLNQELVFYYPFDPDVGDPYGRSPILPILQIVFFQIEVMKDLRKVAHHQGHARFDISVVEEAIIKAMPDTIKFAGPEAVNGFVQSFVRDVQTQMAALGPDDDFFHTDSVKVDTVGGINGKSMDVTKIIDVINQQIVTGLKQLPILLGRNEGTTETHGTIQWQIYVAGIESIQRGIKRLLERAYNVALQVNGRQSRARLSFNDLRTNDRYKEAQAVQIETDTKIKQVQQGWISNNEAALEMVEHEAVSDPLPAPGAPVPLRIMRQRRTPHKRQPKTRAAEDEYVKVVQAPWASDVARKTTEAADAFHALLISQLRKYKQNLRNAPDVPTRMLVAAKRMNQMNREAIPDPPADFEQWVRVNVLKDSGEQMTLWNDEGLTWMEQAAQIAGESSLVELNTGTDFDTKDEQLLHWLADRANSSADLIQGTTDRDVIYTLWDQVYNGKFTIPQMAAALEDAHTFSLNRATVIARTEVLNAARGGQYFGDMQSGMVIGKRWQSAHQPNTRPAHREADGQVAFFDEPFMVMGQRLLFPGDHSMGATASNIIQCRCQYTRILEGEQVK